VVTFASASTVVQIPVAQSAVLATVFKTETLLLPCGNKKSSSDLAVPGEATSAYN
jgi:hypothetical protein